MKYIGMTLAPVTLRFIYTIGSYKAVFVSAALLILLWIFVFSIRNTKAETAYVNDQEI